MRAPSVTPSALLALLAGCTAPVATTDPGDDTSSGPSADTTSDTAPDTAAETASDTGTDPATGSLTLSLDADVVTLIHTSWVDRGASDAWIEYRAGDGDWQVAPAVVPGSAVLLGIPAETEVEAVLVEVLDGAETRSEPATITTGTLPRWLKLPEVHSWHPELADAAPYAMVSLAGGDAYTFQGPWQILIFDREGRVVWYRQVPDSMFVLYAQASLDGTHLWYDASDIFQLGNDTGHATRLTLDGRWTKRIELDKLGQAVDEGPDGSFYYEKRDARSGTVALMSTTAEGEVSTIWDCTALLAELGERLPSCYMNASNWVPAHGTVLASMFESNTVFEIDLATGEPIRQMGELSEGEPYTFADPSTTFSYQHYPNYTDAGTLLVSTHQPGVSGVQYANEYVVDDTTRTLTRTWSYESTDTWATQIGEALRLRNGNTLQGYGQDGGVREVTPDGQEAWFVTWEKDNSGYRAMGHTELIDDLYALNRGPE